MFDLNAIVNAALTAAVAEAIRPLVERITALENNPAIGTDTVLAERVKALEERPAVAGVITPEMIVESMNKAEWLWEKVNAYIETGIDDRIERAIDDHCSTYDHDEYDSVYNEWGGESVDDFVKDGYIEEQIEEKVNETLRNASFEIRVL
jgi:hypothetical protein